MGYFSILLYIVSQIIISILTNIKISTNKEIFDTKSLDLLSTFILVRVFSTIISSYINYYMNRKDFIYTSKQKIILHNKIKTKTYDSIKKQYHLKDLNDIINKYSDDLVTMLWYRREIISSIFNILAPFYWILSNSSKKNILIIILQILSTFSMFKLIKYTKNKEQEKRDYELKKHNINRQMTAEYQSNTAQADSFINIIFKNEKNILEKSIHLDNLWTSIWLITDLQNIIIVTITIYFTYQMDSVVGLLIFTNISSITGTINRINRFWRQKEVLSVKINKIVNEIDEMESKKMFSYDGEMNDIFISSAENTKFKLIIKNLKLNKGEFVFLKGPPGIGKTTLFNLLTSSNNDVNGTVIIDDEKHDMKVLRDVSRIVHQKQEISSIEGTILEVLTGFIELKDEHKMQINILREIIDTFDSEFPVFSKVLNRIKEENKNIDVVIEMEEQNNLLSNDILNYQFPKGLSGGENGFMNIIYMIMMVLLYPKIRIVFLDEIDAPMNGQQVYSIFDIVKKKCWLSNVTIIMISHHPEMLLHSDRWIEFSNDKSPVIHNESYNKDISEVLNDSKILEKIKNNPTFKSMILNSFVN